jgi:ribosomal protein S18 acetylase RimI-like enzyme
MSALEVRSSVKPGDAVALAAIARACGNFSDDEIAFVPEILDELADKGEAVSGYRLLVAEDAGGPLAFAIFGPIPATDRRFDLYWIATDPQAQGKGAGRMLLEECVSRARAEGGQRLFIETEMGEAYAAAHRLYEACGFRLIATIPDYYRDGAGRAIYGGPL